MMGHQKRVLKHSAPPPGFSPLSHDSPELARMLESAVQTQARAEVTLGVAETSFKTKLPGKVRVLGGGRESLEFPVPDHFKTTPSEAFAIVFLEKSNLLCVQSSSVALDRDRLVIRTPWRAFQLQRRGGLRVEIGGAYEYSAEIFAGVGSAMAGRILDLSGEGMSVLVSKEQAQRLSKGQKISSLIFRIDGVQISLEAAVTYQSEHGRGVRVGCKFKTISAEDGERISVFMARHLVQSFG